MSYADKVFKDMCQKILDDNFSTEGQKVRPVWEDGTPAYTIKNVGVCNVYDLRKEFPALTLRRTGLKSALDEILWIYQKKSNNIHDLNSHIWDQWADENGTIGEAYGFQVGKTYLHHTSTDENIYDDVERLKELPSGRIEVNIDSGTYEIYLDQIDSVLYDLKYNPFSRRIMTNLYNFQDLNKMHLYPCAYSMTFSVTDEGNDKLILNLLLNQRSNDILVANNWNVSQYALMLMMIAQSVDMIPGKLIHMIADAHIYDRHIDSVKELLTREGYYAPKVSFNPEIKNFYDFTVNDLIVEDYKTHPQIKNIPVAI